MLDPAKNQLLQHDTRRQIYDAVVGSPGIHLRGLHKALDIPLTTVDYHARRLERASVLRARRFNVHKSYFPHWLSDAQDQRYLYYLHRHSPRTILRIILENPRSTVESLGEGLEISPPTISYHLKSMTDEKVVRAFWSRGRRYFELTDEERLRELLERFPAIRSARSDPAADAP
jgi:predicted transcriptional regulator